MTVQNLIDKYSKTFKSWIERLKKRDKESGKKI